MKTMKNPSHGSAQPEIARTGPYIVTTKNVLDHRADVEALLSGPRAVATLDEAAAVVVGERRRALDRQDGPASTSITLTEEGGTVGPLPDGTVIEVEPAEFSDLWRETGRAWSEFRSPDTDGQVVVDAFNERHA